MISNLAQVRSDFTGLSVVEYLLKAIKSTNETLILSIVESDLYTARILLLYMTEKLYGTPIIFFGIFQLLAHHEL